MKIMEHITLTTNCDTNKCKSSGNDKREIRVDFTPTGPTPLAQRIECPYCGESIVRSFPGEVLRVVGDKNTDGLSVFPRAGTMEKSSNTYSGQGELIFGDYEGVHVNYRIDEFQESVPDGWGGELPTVRDRRGRVWHAEGHPNWHPIASLHSGPFTLVMSDGRKLKVFLKTADGMFQGTGDFF